MKHDPDLQAELSDESFLHAALFQAVDRSSAIIRFNVDGTILWANDNFLGALGYSLDEVVGKHHRMFVAKEEHSSDAYRRHWTDLARGRFLTGEYRRIRKTGEEIWITAVYSGITDKSGTPVGVIKVASDVTQQHRMRQALTETVRSIQHSDFADVATDTMRQIDDASAKIVDIAGIIDEVARRTQMLGINAEIEAAHAGEHGRGFSVVAKEIRVLARSVAESVEQIHGVAQTARTVISDGRGRVEASADQLRGAMAGVAEFDVEANGG